jgi:hypothetical protein
MPACKRLLNTEFHFARCLCWLPVSCMWRISRLSCTPHSSQMFTLMHLTTLSCTHHSLQVPTFTHLTTLLQTPFLAGAYSYASHDSPAHPIPRRCLPLCISRLSCTPNSSQMFTLMHIKTLSCTHHSLQVPTFTHLTTLLHTPFLADA